MYFRPQINKEELKSDQENITDANEDGIDEEDTAEENSTPKSRLLLEFPKEPFLSAIIAEDQKEPKFQCKECLFKTDSFRRFRQHQLR